jgi:transcriptional regulator with XRE-family HTH domain
MGFNILKIKSLLTEKKITIQEFSRAINVSRPTVANYFNGRSKIDVYTIEDIASYLDVPVSYFFEEPTNEVKEPAGAYTKKPKYIEQRIDEIEQRLKKIERTAVNTDSE